MATRYYSVITHCDKSVGASVRRDARKETIELGGWYDGNIEMDSITMSTRDFLKRIGFKGAILDFFPSGQ